MLIPFILFGEENYLCLGEKSVGYFKEKGIWIHKGIYPEKYTVKILNNKMILKKFGNDMNLCDVTLTHTVDFFYQCLSYWEGVVYRIFDFHPTKLRFTNAYIAGYTRNIVGDTPNLAIGKCSRF